jgi:hypothetical protein
VGRTRHWGRFFRLRVVSEAAVSSGKAGMAIIGSSIVA